MTHEEEIELRDRMILSFAAKLSANPEQQRKFIRLAEDDAKDAMSKPVYQMPNPEAA